MEEVVTKEDLRQLRLLLAMDFERIILNSQSRQNQPEQKDTITRDWVKGHYVRELLDISAGTLQRLRIEDKIRFTKVRGTYYYNKNDLQNLFEDK